MEIDRNELKRIARERMKLANPKFWLVTLVYCLMTTVLVNVVGLIPTGQNSLLDVTFFLTILLSLYTIVVDFGFTLWSLWIFRQLDPGLNSLFQGFSIVGRVLWLQFSIFTRVFGWVLVLYTVFAAPLLIGLSGIASVVPPMLIIVLFALVFYCATWAIMLRYTLAPYLLADQPDDGVGLAIHRSVELMKGWKWELFKLELSFLGWELINLALTAAVLIVFLLPTPLIALITSGNWNAVIETYSAATSGALCVLLSYGVTLPLFLWLHPYREVTRAGFYDARLRLHRARMAPPPPV